MSVLKTAVAAALGYVTFGTLRLKRFQQSILNLSVAYLRLKDDASGDKPQCGAALTCLAVVAVGAGRGG